MFFLLVSMFSPFGPTQLTIPFPRVGVFMRIVYSILHFPIYFIAFPSILYLYTHHFVPKVTTNFYYHGIYLYSMFMAVFVLTFKGYISAIFISLFMAGGVLLSLYLKEKNQTQVLFGGFLGVFWGIWLWKIIGGDFSRSGFIRRNVPEYYFREDVRNVFS